MWLLVLDLLTKGDHEGVEEYYSCAVQAPVDGKVLSQYAELVWELMIKTKLQLTLNVQLKLLRLIGTMFPISSCLFMVYINDRGDML
jgi:cobalamin biosynthesis Mg chelatase CobN